MFPLNLTILTIVSIISFVTITNSIEVLEFVPDCGQHCVSPVKVTALNQCCLKYGYIGSRGCEKNGQRALCGRNETLSELTERLRQAMEKMKAKYELKLSENGIKLKKCGDDHKKYVESMEKNRAVIEGLINKMNQSKRRR